MPSATPLPKYQQIQSRPHYDLSSGDADDLASSLLRNVIFLGFRVRQQLGCLVVPVGRSRRLLRYESYVWYIAIALFRPAYQAEQFNSIPCTPCQRSSTFNIARTDCR